MAYCLHCNALLPKTAKKYCDTVCMAAFVAAEKYKRFIAGENDTFLHPRTLREAVIKRDGYKCAECGITEWQGSPITLETEHIDGNSDNDTSPNLCLLCPNCHSQTSTYKAKNKGNGRHSRRQRYAEGKSY